jgi:hypothetical protein
MENLKPNKLTIITPSYRINNLLEIKKSLNFEYIEEWIIVYDGNRIATNPYIFKENEKIKEYIYKCSGISGNGQRLLTEGFLGWGVWADGWAEGWVEVGWVDGVMGLRVGFININDMYNNDVGKGVVYAYEAYEVK